VFGWPSILTCRAISKGRTGLPQQSLGRRTPSDWQSAGGPASIGLCTRQSDGIPALEGEFDPGIQPVQHRAEQDGLEDGLSIGCGQWHLPGK